MNPFVREMLDRLGNEGEYHELRTQVQQEARVNAPAVVELFEALEGLATGTGQTGWRFRLMRDEIPEALAISGNAKAAHLLLGLLPLPERGNPIGPAPRPAGQAPAREVASWLGEGQPVATLFGLLESYMLEDHLTELFACWIHEHVIRGSDFTDQSVVGVFRDRLLLQGHALADLPLYRLNAEADLPRWLPTRPGQFRDLHAIYYAPESGAPAEGQASATLTELHTPPEAILAAVEGWAEGSNGKMWSVECTYDPGVALSADVVARLGHDWFQPLETDYPRVAQISLKEVVGNLFAAAANGGAYGRGQFGAYARERVWTSIAGFLGHETVPAPEAVAQEAARHHWFGLATDSEWFNRIAWDVGLACQTRDLRKVTILVATDTD